MNINQLVLEAVNKDFKSALIIIDVVNSCADKRWEMPEWGLTYNKIRTMIPKLVKFIDWYKKNTNGLVIYINVVPWIEKNLPKNINKLYNDNPDAKFYTTYKPEESIKFYKVKPKSDDIVITKNSYDAFSSPKLQQVLKKNNINHIP